MKQHSAHPHEADPQLGSARHGVFRSFKPRTLSGWRISIAHMITTPHWIASSSPGFFSTIANWMLFLQLVRALSLQLYVVLNDWCDINIKCRTISTFRNDDMSLNQTMRRM